jgi:hypothetical protein
MAKGDADRTGEAEISIGALRIAEKFGGTASMTKVKDNIPDFVELTEADKAKSKTRPNEQMYAQIVGNIVSHRSTPGNIIYEEYALYDEATNSISITATGAALLRSKGY